MVEGKVYLIGAGPGWPDLITVRGQNILKEADVVIYDYLADKRALASVKGEAELICADRLGKSRYSNGFTHAQDKINTLMVKKTLQGKKVARLKNGDPSIFGRLSEELEALNDKKIPYEIVPGITAASAAAAYSGIPLTARGVSSSVVFVTGHEDPNKKASSIDWKGIASVGTITLYMAVETLPGIVKRLIAAGKSKNTSVAVISRAGDMYQKTVKGELDDIAQKVKKAGIVPPAIIIVGEVAKLEKKFNWLEKTKRILYTGLSDERYFLDGTYFHLPLIQIKPIKNYRDFDKHIRQIEEFDWIVFSSRFGVTPFFERLFALGKDARALIGVKIAAVGQSTAKRLLDFGVKADLVPKRERADDLLAELEKIGVKGKKIFLPRSDIADKGLNEGLKKLGASPVGVDAYRNVMPDDLPELDLSFFDEIMFTSPSTVRNFKKRYKSVPKGVKASWIGGVTKRELVRQGLI